MRFRRTAVPVPDEPLQPESPWLTCAECGVEVARARDPIDGRWIWVNADGFPHHWPEPCGGKRRKYPKRTPKPSIKGTGRRRGVQRRRALRG